MNIDNFTKLSKKIWAIIVLACLSTILPGTLFMLLYDYEIIKSLDIFKIILLSIAITAPLLLFHLIEITILLFNKNCPGGNLDSEIILFVGMFMSAVVTYILIISFYFHVSVWLAFFVAEVFVGLIIKGLFYGWYFKLINSISKFFKRKNKSPNRK